MLHIFNLFIVHKKNAISKSVGWTVKDLTWLSAQGISYLRSVPQEASMYFLLYVQWMTNLWATVFCGFIMEG